MDKKKLEKVREQLNSMVNISSSNEIEVLKVSEELDLLIVEFMKGKNKGTVLLKKRKTNGES